MQKKKQESTCPDGACYVHSRFQIGPYLNKDRVFDGSTLLINVTSNREDARLLQKQYQLEQDCKTLGIPLPSYPRLEVSGKIEASYTHMNPYVGNTTDEFGLNAMELDLLVHATSWLSGYVAVDYSKPIGPNAVSSVFLNRAFVTLGDLSIMPFYASAGKEYVPFGRYSSNMIDAPYTLVLGRTLVNTLVLGYQQTGANALHAEAFIYQGITGYASDQKKGHTEYGGDVGYAYKLGSVSGELGGGYLSNLADSGGFHNAFFKNNVTFIPRQIPAGNMYTSIAYGQFNLLAEYVTALRSFNSGDILYNGKNAKPSAFNTELSYNITSFNRPSSVALGYTSTSQAVTLGLPQRSYRAVYNINVLKNSNLAFQVSHDINYDVASATGTNVDTSQLGKKANSLSVAFDYFF